VRDVAWLVAVIAGVAGIVWGAEAFAEHDRAPPRRPVAAPAPRRRATQRGPGNWRDPAAAAQGPEADPQSSPGSQFTRRRNRGGRNGVKWAWFAFVPDSDSSSCAAWRACRLAARATTFKPSLCPGRSRASRATRPSVPPARSCRRRLRARTGRSAPITNLSSRSDSEACLVTDRQRAVLVSYLSGPSGPVRGQALLPRPARVWRPRTPGPPVRAGSKPSQPAGTARGAS
jgi:hypothetical protein